MGMNTILVDGNAVAYTIYLDKCSCKEDFAMQYFDRLRKFSRVALPTRGIFARIILFFDYKQGYTWRDELYPDYQNKRKNGNISEEKQQENLTRTEYLDYIRKIIRATGDHDYISYPHTESDDMIALYTRYIQESDENVVIVTTDNDLYQLVRSKTDKQGQVGIYLITKHKTFFDSKKGREILEHKIMLGDPSDSIPSVCRGVGAGYYPDFKIFLKSMKKEGIDPTDIEKSTKICEKLGIKYIKSFSNYSEKQFQLNRKLVDLNYVCLQDKRNDMVKTDFIREGLTRFRFSPFSIKVFENTSI